MNEINGTACQIININLTVNKLASVWTLNIVRRAQTSFGDSMNNIRVRERCSLFEKPKSFLIRSFRRKHTKTAEISNAPRIKQ